MNKRNEAGDDARRDHPPLRKGKTGKGERGRREGRSVLMMLSILEEVLLLRLSLYPFPLPLFLHLSLQHRFASSYSDSHHCVNTITASGNPSRNPRCGTSKVETAFPQRQVVSGITVNEDGRFCSTPINPFSFVFVSIPQQDPAEAAAEKNQDRRDYSREPIAQHLECPAM